MSTHIKVAWLHELVDEPVMPYSELDNERYETRKVEVFDDGHMEWADLSRESGTTGLGEVPVPDLAEIGPTRSSSLTRSLPRSSRPFGLRLRTPRH